METNATNNNVTSKTPFSIVDILTKKDVKQQPLPQPPPSQPLTFVSPNSRFLCSPKDFVDTSSSPTPVSVVVLRHPVGIHEDDDDTYNNNNTIHRHKYLGSGLPPSSVVITRQISDDFSPTVLLSPTSSADSCTCTPKDLSLRSRRDLSSNNDTSEQQQHRVECRYPTNKSGCPYEDDIDEAEEDTSTTTDVEENAQLQPDETDDDTSQNGKFEFLRVI